MAERCHYYFELRFFRTFVRTQNKDTFAYGHTQTDLPLHIYV